MASSAPTAVQKLRNAHDACPRQRINPRRIAYPKASFTTKKKSRIEQLARRTHKSSPLPQHFCLRNPLTFQPYTQKATSKLTNYLRLFDSSSMRTLRVLRSLAFWHVTLKVPHSHRIDPQNYSYPTPLWRASILVLRLVHHFLLPPNPSSGTRVGFTCLVFVFRSSRDQSSMPWLGILLIHSCSAVAQLAMQVAGCSWTITYHQPAAIKI